MKRIRFLHIEFENALELDQVPRFRSEVIRIAGRENVLFHNHIDDSYRYSYPLIQYKSIFGRAGITCLEDGVDAVHLFFEKKRRKIRLGDSSTELLVEKMFLNHYNMQAWNKSFNYHIRNWLALNQVNHKHYGELNSENEKMEFLEKILTGNIISLGKGIGWNIDKKIEVEITGFTRERLLKVKETKRKAISLDFNCNVFLPDFLGLGKNVSIGYGNVKRINTKAENGQGK